MNSFLPIYFPEWQGYAEDQSVLKGAEIIFNALKDELDFESIYVEEYEELEERERIIGYDSILSSFIEFKRLLEHREPDRTFLLGGTCASEIAPVSYLNDKYNGDLAVLWFDAHGDLNTPESSNSKHFHGMPLRTLIGEGNEVITNTLFSHLKPEQVILVGGRDLDIPEQEYITRSNISLLSPDMLVQNPDLLVNEIRNKGYKNVYLHLDLDILDPESFSHLLLHVPGGVSLELLKRLVKSVSQSYPIVGSSILEYVQRGEGGVEEVKELVSLLLN